MKVCDANNDAQSGDAEATRLYGTLPDMTEDEFDPIIARLQTGELARQLREAAKVDFGDADKALGGYSGKLSKIESGTIAPQPPDVDAMIKLYKPSSAKADQLRALATDARRRSAPAKVSGGSRQYVALERRAAEIRMVYNEIPGLLQTREFAQAALSRSLTVAAADVPGLAEERAERGKRIIRPDGPAVWIVLGEDALMREFGGRDVLRRQLEHLRTVTEMSNVRFRVLPWSAGGVPALSCPFTLLYVDSEKTLAYVASLTRTDYIKATGPYVAAFEQAWKLAPTEEESAAILAGRITDLNDS